MSDRFDADLKQAFTESTARSLEGWEFSPAMRQAVLKRVAEEEETQSAAPVHRSRPGLTRPFMWIAAAAAAFFVAFNMLQFRDPGYGGGNMRSDSAPRASGAAMTAPQSVAQGSTNNSTVPSGLGMKRAGESIDMAAAQPKIEAATASTSQGVAEQADMRAATSAPRARIHLIAPESGDQSVGVGVAMKQASGNNVGVLSVQPTILAMAPPRSGQTPVLTSAGLQLVDSQGVVVTEQPLPGGPGLLATAQNGRIGVSVGDQVYLFSAVGEPDGSLRLPAPVSALALSSDGRLAAVAGETLLVYAGEKLQLKLPGLTDAAIGFSLDGTLAVMAHDGTGRFLQLFGQDGVRLARSAVMAEGSGLTFAADGQFVVAGGEAFHRSGQAVWQAPFPTRGLATLGPSGPVVLWGEQAVSLVRAEDGTEVWTAEYASGRILAVAVSAAGDQIAVLGSHDGGAIVWVLDRAGGQRFVEKLAVVPIHLVFEGDTLQLLTPQGLENRTLNR